MFVELVKGCSNKEIVCEFGMSELMVKGYLVIIFCLLCVCNCVEVVLVG